MLDVDKIKNILAAVRTHVHSSDQGFRNTSLSTSYPLSILKLSAFDCFQSEINTLLSPHSFVLLPSTHDCILAPKSCEKEEERNCILDWITYLDLEENKLNYYVHTLAYTEKVRLNLWRNSEI